MPRVSVLVAAYNAEKTIADCLRSLQQQTMTDWEAVVVDDASTDQTADLVGALGNDDPRIRYFRLPQNSGSGAARNFGLNVALSPLLAILDADDLCLPTRLEDQLEVFDQYPDTTVVSGHVLEFGDWGGPELTRRPLDPQEVRNQLADGRMPIAHCAVVMSLSSVLEVGGYDEACRRAQDFALFRRMRQSIVLRGVDKAVVAYRTTRPLPLRYAILSGRYGRLARARTELGREEAEMPGSLAQLKWLWLTDLRSILSWVRRRGRERRKFHGA